MTFDLKGKTALVTGGTSGIGKSIALALAKEGVKVALFGQNHERGAAVVEQMRALTDSALFVSVDVSDHQAVQAAIKEILDVFQDIDIVVNNAGITKDQLLIKMSESHWDEVMAINVKSCYNVCHALARSMIRKRAGSIINMSSVVGINGNAGQVNYAASKAAVIGFTKALAKELAARNVRVNCIAPGFIDTPMTEALTEGQKNEALSSIPLGRFGRTEDVAAMALFLASDLSQYITGQVFSIDGGMAL